MSYSSPLGSPAGNEMEFVVTVHPVGINDTAAIPVATRLDQSRKQDCQDNNHCYDKEKATHVFDLSAGKFTLAA